MFTLGIRTRLKSLELVTIILVNTPRSQTGTTPGAARSAPGRLRVVFETHTRLPLHAPTALLPLT